MQNRGVLPENNHDILQLMCDMNKKDIDYILDLWKRNAIHDELPILGSGEFGTVFEYKDVAIKVFHHPEDEEDDARILHTINNSEYYPKLYGYIQNHLMIVEKIEGVMLDEINSYPEYQLADDWLYHIEKAFTLASDNQLIPYDATAHNIVITKEGFPIIVDVGSYQKSFNKQFRENEIQSVLKTLLIQVSELEISRESNMKVEAR